MEKIPRFSDMSYNADLNSLNNSIRDSLLNFDYSKDPIDIPIQVILPNNNWVLRISFDYAVDSDVNQIIWILRYRINYDMQRNAGAYRKGTMLYRNVKLYDSIKELLTQLCDIYKLNVIKEYLITHDALFEELWSSVNWRIMRELSSNRSFLNDEETELIEYFF